MAVAFSEAQRAVVRDRLIPRIDRVLAILEAHALVDKKRQALDAAERALERKIGRLFTVQGRLVVKRLAGFKAQFAEALSQDEADALMAAASIATRGAWVDALTVAAEDALTAGADALAADLPIGVSFTLKNPRAVAYLQSVGAERVTRIDEATRAELRRILADAVDQGWTYDQAAKAILAKFKEFGTPQPQAHIRSRAHLIAQTETGDAYEAGNRIVADQVAASGYSVEKRWLVASDRVCDFCIDDAGVGWIPVADAFPSGHQQPTGHPSCRCAVAYRTAAAA
jgi:hypothetical protein